MFLNNILIGTLEDNVDLLVNKDFYLTSQPVIDTLFFIIKKYTGISSVLFSNLLVILTFSLIFFTCFKLFRAYFSRCISVVLSLIFIFSPYHLYHLRGHLSLIQTWTVVLYLHLFLKSKNIKDYILLSLYVGLVSLISNYLAFFLLLFILLFTLIKILMDYILSKSFHTTEIKNYLVHIIISAISVAVLLWPYVKVNYFNLGTNDTQVNSAISSEIELSDIERPRKVRFERPLEDFVIFSAKPWYYLLPSVDNPFFGNISNTVITTLQNKWGYYLTFNYFKSEHSANYLGLVNLIFAIMGFVFVVKKVFPKIKTKRDPFFVQLFLLSFVGLGFIVLSMPPYFTIFGLKIFMPSFLLWKIFPMFRILSRLGIFILLIELIFTGFGITNFIKKYNNRKILLLPILVLSLMEFYIPLKLTDLSSMPQVYTYVKEDTLEKSSISVYPYSKTLESRYWQSDFKRNIINTKGSEELVQDLLFCFDFDYLIYFKNSDTNYKINNLFLENNPMLEKVSSFEHTNRDEIDLGILSRFVRIIESGNTFSNSTVVYKVNKITKYNGSNTLDCLTNSVK